MSDNQNLNKNQIISQTEVEIFRTNSVLIGNLKLIWENLYNSLPSHLQKETKLKKLILKEYIGVNSRIDKTYRFKIINASEELNQHLDQINNFIICFEE